MLNVSYTVFKGKNKAASDKAEVLSESQVEEIRALAIHSLLQRLGADYSAEHHLGARQLLIELAESK